MFNLRDYQRKAVEETWQLFYPAPKKPRAVCIVAPTGAGKTILIAELASRFVNAFDYKVLILAHRKELLVQNGGALSDHGVNFSLYCAGLNEKDLSSKVVVASQGSFTANNLKDFKPDVIICDEAHRINTNSTGRYRELIEESGAHLIGLTATPFRLRGTENFSIIKDRLDKRDTRLFTHLIQTASIPELIKEKHLCDLISFAPQKASIDRTKLKTSSTGDFVLSSIAATHEQIIGLSVQDVVKKTTERKQVIVFCSTIEHCEMVQDELKKHEETSVVVTGKTLPLLRQPHIDKFKNKEVKFLIGCDIFTEGFDCKTIDAVVLFRPTNSAALYLQMTGRGFRPHPDKDNCLLLDYGGNIKTHGAVNKIKISHKFIKPQQSSGVFCFNCGLLMDVYPEKCPDCGQCLKEEIKKQERQIKLDTLASYLDPVDTKSKVTEKFENPKIYITIHKTKNGKHCLRKIYCENAPLGNISLIQWNSPNHIKSEYLNFGNYFSNKYWKEWVGDDHEQSPTNALDAMFYLYTNKTPLPQRMEIIHEGTRHDFENVKVIKTDLKSEYVNIDDASVLDYIEEKNIKEFPQEYLETMDGRNFHLDIIAGCPF